MSRLLKKPYFIGIFLPLMLLMPLFHASAEGSRFFIKSKSGFLENTLAARHVFDNGFTADISDIQLGLLKLFRVDVEPVATLHILDASPASPSPLPGDSGIISKFKVLRNKRGQIIRYLPADQTPWGIQAVYGDSKLTKTSGGAGVTVAVLDSGANINHPDLKNRIVACEDFTSFSFAIVDNQCDDRNGHGTHVAGVIAADGGSDSLGIYGVAPQAELMIYKVCGSDGACYADDIATGLRQAVDNGARVINMSFGTDKDVPLVADAVDYAASHGALLVAAAGNDGPYQDSIDYPAAYQSVVSVGALGQSLIVADWSSRGINSLTKAYQKDAHDIEFAAPGDSIESAWKNGGYAVLSGTSMAAPFVSGLAAKYWQTPEDPSQTSPQDVAQETRDVLHGLSQDIAPVGDDDATGWGMPVVK